MSISIGAHVDQTDPIAEARARQAPLVQFFLCLLYTSPSPRDS